MPSLIETSLWVAFTRRRSPRHVKKLFLPYILAADAAIAEPIAFEVLRHADDKELPLITAQFASMVVLPTPSDLWSRAANLGQMCKRQGISAGGLDLLIATISLHYDVELVTLDGDFVEIAKVCKLRVKLLRKPPA